MACDISTRRFLVTINGVQLRLPYFRSHSLFEDHSEIELAVFAFHGVGDPDGEEYMDRVHDAAATVPGALTTTLIVAPQIAEWSHLESFFGAGNVPPEIIYFDGPRFWGGQSANSSAQVSAFTVIDRMLEHICDSGHFPNLKRIVLVGHSGGGQLVNRFAASSPFSRHGIAMRYIVMNPSTFVYFDDARVIPGTQDQFVVPTAATRRQFAACASDSDYNKYNEYGYGLEDLYHYQRDLGTTAAVMIDRYRSRNVVYLSGALDNNPSSAGFDDSCGAMLQGPNRLDRGTIYHNYLQYFYGPTILDRHIREIVPNVGHNGRSMITSDIGVNYIFEEFSGAEMVSVADYFVIRDTKITLRSGQRETLNFDVPREIVRSGGSKRPILTYYADPSSDAENLTLMVDINGTQVSDYRYSGGVGRGHQEVINHENLNAGEENSIRFRVESGRGSVQVADIVLWFQRAV